MVFLAGRLLDGDPFVTPTYEDAGPV